MKPLLLFLALAVLWLLLSQHLEPLLLGFGVLSCALVVFLMHRMEPPAMRQRTRRARRLHPLRLVRYWAWLAVEITRANLAVARAILAPSLPISPAMLQVPASGMGDMGQVIYANSITLTPGTISVDLDEDRITVHALFHEAAAELLAGEMMRRAAAVESAGTEHADRAEKGRGG